MEFKGSKSPCREGQNPELSMSELRLLAPAENDEASPDLGRHEEGASRKSGGALSPMQLLNCLAT